MNQNRKGFSRVLGKKIVVTSNSYFRISRQSIVNGLYSQAALLCIVSFRWTALEAFCPVKKSMRNCFCAHFFTGVPPSPFVIAVGVNFTTAWPCSGTIFSPDPASSPVSRTISNFPQGRVCILLINYHCLPCLVINDARTGG
jgi:hypothetical protein